MDLNSKGLFFNMSPWVLCYLGKEATLRLETLMGRDVGQWRVFS